MYKYLYFNLRSQNFPYVNIFLFGIFSKLAFSYSYLSPFEPTHSVPLLRLIVSGVNFSCNSFSCCFIQYLFYCLELYCSVQVPPCFLYILVYITFISEYLRMPPLFPVYLSLVYVCLYQNTSERPQNTAEQLPCARTYSIEFLPAMM
jgi:hypothetical protein